MKEKLSEATVRKFNKQTSRLTEKISRETVSYELLSEAQTKGMEVNALKCSQ